MAMEPSIELDTSILLSTPRNSNSCVTPAVCRVTPYIFVNELTFQAVIGSLKGPPVNNVCDLHIVARVVVAVDGLEDVLRLKEDWMERVKNAKKGTFDDRLATDRSTAADRTCSSSRLSWRVMEA